MKQERFDTIMAILTKDHFANMKNLAEVMDVSNETVRRDLLELQDQGMLRCVRGGAVLDTPTANEYDIKVRINTSAQEKQAICQTAIGLIEDGDSLAIEAATTTLGLGPLLATKNDLTIITNSIYIGNEAAKNPSNSVIIAGGTLDSTAQKNMGTMTVEAFKTVRADKGIFSSSSISPEFGVTEYNEREADVVKAIIEISKSAILLADYRKFNLVGFRKLCDLDRINTIVTDWHVNEKELSPLRKMGIKICCADEEEE